MLRIGDVDGESAGAEVGIENLLALVDISTAYYTAIGV
jgi:hypothetical protein